MLGLPLDGLVEFYHAVAASSGPNEPAVERIIEDGLIGTPAVGIIVHVLLNLECGAVLLHAHTHVHVEIFSLGGGSLIVFSVDGIFGVVGVFHICTLVFLIKVYVHIFCHEVGVKFVKHPIFALHVDHGASLEFLGDHEQRRDAGGTCHIGIIGTECGSDMHNAGTVVGGDIVTGYHTEAVVVANNLAVGFVDRLHPRKELAVADAHEVGTAEFGNHLKGDNLVALLVGIERKLGTLCLEVGIETSLGQHIDCRLTGIWVVTLHSHIVIFRAHTKCCV